MKDSNYLKDHINQIVITSLLAFFLIIYLLGLFLGFNKSIFSFSIDYIGIVIIFEFITILSEEIMRYIICRNQKDSKVPIILYTIGLCLLNIIIEINGYDLTDKEALFIFTSKVIIPTISRELLCSYLTYKVSYTPSIIFKSTICLYEYIIPIVPNLGNYIYSVANVILPYIIFYFSSKVIKKGEKTKEYTKKALRRILYIPIVICLIILTILVSGIFSYKMVSIGSNSMKPIYGRGDAVIYKKTNYQKVKAGEILAFERDGRIITHRVITIKKDGNLTSYRTKGDANKSPDTRLVESAEVLGVVKYKIKYIGYPTLWVREIFEERNIGD